MTLVHKKYIHRVILVTIMGIALILAMTLPHLILNFIGGYLIGHYGYELYHWSYDKFVLNT